MPPVVATAARGKEKDKNGQDIDTRPLKRKKTSHNGSVPALLNKTSDSKGPQLQCRRDFKLPENRTSVLDGSKQNPKDTSSEQNEAKLTGKRKNKKKKFKTSTFEIPSPAEEVEDVVDTHKSIRAKYHEASKTFEEASQSNDQTLVKDDEDALERIQSIGLQPLPQPESVPDGPKSTIFTLPKWMNSPVYANKTASFVELNLAGETVKRLSDAKFDSAFAIQTTIIPMLLPGPYQHKGDVCVAAATGSGKTLAYTLPIIEALRDKPVTRLRALIIVPTRELVAQVQDVFRITGSSLSVGTAVGSKSLREERDMLIEVDEVYDPKAYKKVYGRKFDSLRRWDLIEMSDAEDMDDEFPKKDHVFERSSKVDVLVCTPGRLVDHLRSTKGFTLKHLQWLVIDEADRLLDQSFQQWLDMVIPELERKPLNDDFSHSRYSRLRGMVEAPLRKIILSATMTRDHSKLLALNLHNPILVTVEGSQQDSETRPQTDSEPILTSIPKQLVEVAIAVKDAAEKPLYLLQLIRDQFDLQDLELHRNGTVDEELPNARSSDESKTSEGIIGDDDGTSSQTSIDSSEDRLSTGGTTSSVDISSSGEESDSSSISRNKSPANSNKSTLKNHRPEKRGMLVFTNTNESALRLCRLLILLQPSWASRILPLTKSIGTSSGRKALSAFRRNKIDIIIATDLASRGLDLKNLAHVVNYDMPKSLNAYIHRVGRTARAGQSGVASTLVSHHEARWFWHEIGKCSTLDREQKVKRQVIESPYFDVDRDTYEKALECLGKEAKGV